MSWSCSGENSSGYGAVYLPRILVYTYVCFREEAAILQISQIKALNIKY